MKLPAPLRWLKDGWMAFSHILGIIMSRIILTLFWVVGIGMYGIVRKIIMLFQKKTDSQSEWQACHEETVETMKYQF